MADLAAETTYLVTEVEVVIEPAVSENRGPLAVPVVRVVDMQGRVIHLGLPPAIARQLRHDLRRV